MYQIDKKTADELISLIKELNNVITKLIEKFGSSEKSTAVDYDPDDYLKKSFPAQVFSAPINPEDRYFSDEPECLYHYEDNMGIPNGEEDIW